MVTHFSSSQPFQLESGEQLDRLRIAYAVFGDDRATETIWVCHALSGNALVPEWWGGLFGPDKLFHFGRYRVICANVVGSCYGTTGPDDYPPAFPFPLITVRDMVNAHELLRQELGIQRIDLLIGASLGGQQALEWAITAPENCIQKVVLIAANAVHSPFGRAFNEAQRLALRSDATFGQKGGGEKGLIAARSIAMLSYRSYDDFSIKQSDAHSKVDDYRAASYVRYQGKKFARRFSARAYYSLSKSMDSHDVGRQRGPIASVLKKIAVDTLVVGVDSDMLFPLAEQQFLVDNMKRAQLQVIRSRHGHDAFLIEYPQLENILTHFLKEKHDGYKT